MSDDAWFLIGFCVGGGLVLLTLWVKEKHWHAR